MASTVQKLFNEARIRFGGKPFLVTTSDGVAEVTTTSPLLEILGVQNTEMTTRKDFRFVAEAVGGLRNPENQIWLIHAVVKGFEHQKLMAGDPVLYPEMLEIMKANELAILREAGFHGTDKEIIALRRRISPRNNVLRFVQ